MTSSGKKNEKKSNKPKRAEEESSPKALSLSFSLSLSLLFVVCSLFFPRVFFFSPFYSLFSLIIKQSI